MADEPLSGDMLQGEAPDWGPLERLGFLLLGDFMWMFEARLENGVRIDAYKHRISRRYLHLAGDGRAFDYRDGSYVPIPIERAVHAVYDSAVSWPRRPSRAA